MLTHQPPAAPSTCQRGVALLEALVAILIFSIGILALVGLQARAISTTSDAKYRSDATFLANKIIGIMWGDKANLTTYATASAAAQCASGTAATGTNIAAWLNEVNAMLPGADITRQRILVDNATGQVAITICWLVSPSADPTITTNYHKYEVTARIQDNS